MTRIVSSKSGRFKHQLNGDGSRTLVISDAYEFVECLRMIWQKAKRKTKSVRKREGRKIQKIAGRLN